MAKEVLHLNVADDRVDGVLLREEGKNLVRAGEFTLTKADYEAQLKAAAEEAAAAEEQTPAKGAAVKAAEVVAEEDAVPFLDAAFAAAANQFKVKECSLSLALNRLLVKTISIPPEKLEEREVIVNEEIEAISPWDDEELLIASETLREDDTGTTVLAAALAEDPSEELSNALAAADVTVMRTDITALVKVRNAQLVPAPGVRVVRLESVASGWEMAVVEDGLIVRLRNLSAEGFTREVMLTLMQCEAERGTKQVQIELLAGAEPPANVLAALKNLGEVTLRIMSAEERTAEELAAAEAAARRLREQDAFDVTPAMWREVRHETVFMQRLKFGATIAGSIWVLIALVIFGVPMTFGWMTSHQKGITKKIDKQYKEVKSYKDRVDVVRKYSDRTMGALEMLKAVSDRLGEGVTLSSYMFKSGDSINVAGEAPANDGIYSFKDEMDKMATVDDERLFPDVKLTGPTAIRNGGAKFSLQANFKSAEDDK